MKAAGIIAEYNPFHKGHAYHILKTRELGFTHIVAVMSGNYVQRGQPAVMRKEARVRAALAGGADLVIELPLPWAISSAEGFALGAVRLLNAFNCVDALSFGSEIGNISQLEQCAVKLKDINNHAELLSMLKKGNSFPRARQLALGGIHGEAEASLLIKPNDLLGIEYIKALMKTDSDILPVTVKRLNTEHDAEDSVGGFASASHIRSLLNCGNFDAAYELVPEYAEHIYKSEAENGYLPFDYRTFEGHMLSYLRRLGKELYKAFPDVNEGLENRIFEAVKAAASLDELYALIKTKRYTMSRVRRILLAAFLGCTKNYKQLTPPYLRCMGFNERGTEILRHAKNHADLPVISRYSDLKKADGYSAEIFELESRAADLYNLCFKNVLKCGEEKTFSPVKL